MKYSQFNNEKMKIRADKKTISQSQYPFYKEVDVTEVPSYIKDEWYRDFIQNSKESFFISDIRGRFLYVNDSFCRMLGYSRQELLSMKVQDINVMYINNPKKHDQDILKSYQDGLFFSRCAEIQHKRKDGQIIDVLSIYGHMDVLGGIFFHLNIEITEKKRLFMQLEESEERYRSLIELGDRVGEAIIMLQDTDNEEGIQIFVSDKWCDITGYSREELIGKSFFKLITQKYRLESLKRHREKIKGMNIPGHFEVSIVTKEGTEVPIELTSASSYYKGSPVNVAYIRDITERKNMERRLKLYSNKIIQAQETERIRLARELHDQAAQDLVVIRIEAEILTEQLRKANCDCDTKRLLSLTDNALDNIQSISSRLRPQLLERLGIIEALKSYIEDFENQSGISCRLILNGCLPKNILSNESSTIAYRIIQEALLNVQRHSKATEVFVSLSKTKNMLKISIEDNGCGMKPGDSEKISSLGIMGMRERASLVGGKLKIISGFGKGTKVNAFLPISKRVSLPRECNEYH